MAKDASQALGAPEVAGTVVSARALTKKRRTARGEAEILAGESAAGAATGKGKGAPEVPGFGRMGYLAVSETTLAVTRTSQLGWTPRSTGVALVQVPRSEVSSITLEQARLLSHLKLRFTNGVIWEFDVPRVHREGAKALVMELGGSVT
ncbi:MAG: hypothetical protein ACJ780_13670 [Solirubrobacteraceae bacterium]